MLVVNPPPVFAGSLVAGLVPGVAPSGLFLRDDGTWQAAGAAGANTALSNIAAVAYSADLVPGADDARTHGSTTKRVRSVVLSLDVSVYGAAGDANPQTKLSKQRLDFGPGGASAVDATVDYASGQLRFTSGVSNAGSQKSFKFVHPSPGTGTDFFSLVGNVTEVLNVDYQGRVRQINGGSSGNSAFSTGAQGYGLHASSSSPSYVVLAAGADTSSLAVRNDGTVVAATNLGVAAAGRLFLDGTSASGGGTPATGDSYIDKSTASGGTIRVFHDGVQAFSVLGNPCMTWNGGHQFSVVSGRTTNITLGLANYAVGFDTSGGALTATLPSAPTAGQEYVLSQEVSAAAVLTVARNGKNINGAASDFAFTTLTIQTVRFVYHGTAGWFTG